MPDGSCLCVFKTSRAYSVCGSCRKCAVFCCRWQGESLGGGKEEISRRSELDFSYSSLDLPSSVMHARHQRQNLEPWLSYSTFYVNCIENCDVKLKNCAHWLLEHLVNNMTVNFGYILWSLGTRNRLEYIQSWKYPKLLIYSIDTFLTHTKKMPISNKCVILSFVG